jgi:hypothetical protein
MNSELYIIKPIAPFVAILPDKLNRNNFNRLLSFQIYFKSCLKSIAYVKKAF